MCFLKLTESINFLTAMVLNLSNTGTKIKELVRIQIKVKRFMGLNSTINYQLKKERGEFNGKKDKRSCT